MAGVWFWKIGMESHVPKILVIFVSKVQEKWRHIHYPLRSMHGLFTYIYQKNQPNVGKYMDISYVGVASPLSFPKRTASLKGGAFNLFGAAMSLKAINFFNKH